MKKITITVSFLLLPIMAVAEDMSGMGMMSEGMMQKMQQMAACMEQIDQSALQALEQKTNQMDKELAALCASGKRDDAQQLAISFAQEVAKSSSLQEIKRCAEMMKVAGMPAPKVPDAEDYSKHHVCDS